MSLEKERLEELEQEVRNLMRIVDNNIVELWSDDLSDTYSCVKLEVIDMQLLKLESLIKR